MSTADADLPQFLIDKRQLGDGETFGFTCHPGVPCFNSCCADINIVLTPADVLRLARNQGMHTREFLETHTSNPITKDLKIPMVMLKMTDKEGKPCPFVGEQGCTVYEDRPWACRMYPLGMAIPPARAGEEPDPLFFVFEDDHCKGREQPDRKNWTAAQWREDQEIDDHEALEDRLPRAGQPPVVYRRPHPRSQADAHALHRVLRPRHLPRIRFRFIIL